MFNTICTLIALGCVGVEAYCFEKFTEELKTRSAEKKAKRDKIGRAKAKKAIAKKTAIRRNRSELFDMLSGEERLYK